MDESTFHALLRVELDIPADLTSDGRVAALEHAFRARTSNPTTTSFDASGETALAYISVGDDCDFYGHMSLYTAFGGCSKKDYPASVHLRPRGHEWMAGLRRRAYKYAVVAFEERTRYQRTT